MRILISETYARHGDINNYNVYIYSMFSHVTAKRNT